MGAIHLKIRWAGFVMGGLGLSLCAGVRGQQAQQPGAAAGPLIRASVTEVLVPVVVKDGHGKIVDGLKKDDFQIFDNGKLREITGFVVEKPAAKLAAAAAAADTASNKGDGAAAAKQPAPTQRFVVLMFDDLNLSSGNLIQAQRAANKMLESPLVGTDMAAVVSTSGTNSGFTKDHAELQKAILGLRVSNLYRQVSHDCPNISYYQADLIVNRNDQIALQAAAADALSCLHLPSMEQAIPVAMQVAQREVQLGDQDVRTTLDFVRLVVAKMGRAPGERMIILISPGFSSISAEAIELNSQILDMAAQNNVIISALDPRGVYSTTMDASQRSSGAAAAERAKEQYKRASMHLDETVMAGLADGTGGTFFHSSNDLEAGFENLMAGPECIYVLAFSIVDVKPDGAYHKLEVKLNEDGMKMQARKGYFAPKESK
jgi:VWFA-related protein